MNRNLLKVHNDHSTNGSRRRATNPKIKFVAGAVAASFVIIITFFSPVVAHAQEGPPRQQGSMFRLFAGQGAFLGVTLKDVTANDVRSMKLPGEYGAIITQVEPGSPAAAAGLRVNDVILEFGGMRVWSAAQLGQLVRETPPGRKVTLRISRAGQKLNLEASLETRKEHAMLPHIEAPEVFISPKVFNFMPPRGRLGIEVETLTPQLANYFGVKQGKGILVTEVEPDSPAAKVGLKAGDCIVKAGSTEVTSVGDLLDALGNAKDSQLTLSIIRGGREQTLNATLGPAWGPNPTFKMQMERQIQVIQRQLPRLEQMDNQLQRRLQDLQKRISTGEV